MKLLHWFISVCIGAIVSIFISLSIEDWIHFPILFIVASILFCMLWLEEEG